MNAAIELWRFHNQDRKPVTPFCAGGVWSGVLTARCNRVVQLPARDTRAARRRLRSVRRPSPFRTSTPRRSHPGGPSLVEQGYILSHQVKDVGSVRAVGTRALEVGLAAKFVRVRPPQSTVDEAAFDPEDDVAEERHPPGRPNATPHPVRGGRTVSRKSENAARPSRE
jgi:hypothetical protein